MLTRLSIATWNLERAALRSWKKLPAIQSRIAAVSADCWVLTETRTSITPGNGYSGVHSPPHHFRGRDPDEHWVSVWSRWPLKVIPVRTTPWSTTALVDGEFGQLIVHGVVLPYQRESSADGGRSPDWVEFSKELSHQAADWATIRREYPDTPLVVAGDFNQNLDGAQWYGNDETRQSLNLALEGAGLLCLTKEDVVAAGKLKRNHLVDHICVSTDLTRDYEVECWDQFSADGREISDHPGVVARVSVDGR